MDSKTELRVLSGPEAPAFLAELMNRITIIARGAYRGIDQADVAKLQASNEMLHAISAKLAGACKGEDRYPELTLMESIRERAGSAFGDEVEWAISDALRAVSSEKK